MFAQTFRFADQRSQWNAFQSRVRSAFEPRKPRHRLLRFVLGVVGLGLLALLVFFSVFVGAAMIAVGLAYKLWQRRGKPMTARAKGPGDVVEGEFRVVAPQALPRAADRAR
ncbi:hypothetical protein RDV84_01620 [Lysobacter yananisis]|uniref:Uncharacterized protein n=1 Tax=Lysobacter yananisis TaxID=1003114 RepID=A0ABY9P918_9GAMM|nr:MULTISPECIES: hypothetical protein [Lysobacter]UZW59735.1 hypothetical protein BV903_020990 [Lysobacter enzymogenes]WMT03575.1 hypothetical protein RDV84_01620 [Lysobacter yananisis]